MKLIVLLLFTSFSFGQSSIVAAGHNSYTIGEVIPIMQQMDTVIQVRLGVPKYEIPIEPKKEVKKKVSFLQSIINFLKTIFK